MDTRTSRLCGVASVFFAASMSSAALVVKIPDITVVANPPGGLFVTQFIDVFVQNDNPATQIGGFQFQAKLPDAQTDVVFHSIGNTVDHPPLLQSAGFVTQIESTRVIGLKASLNPEALVDGGGLGRLRFDVAPGVEGVFPVTLIDLTTDPNFGTGVIDGQFNPLPIEVRSGSITVVIPEPALGTFGALGMMMALTRRRT